MKLVMAGFFSSIFSSYLISEGRILVMALKGETLQGVLKNGSALYGEVLNTNPYTIQIQLVDVDNEFQINFFQKPLFTTDFKSKMQIIIQGNSEVVFQDGQKYTFSYPQIIMTDPFDIKFSFDGKLEILDQKNNIQGQVNLYQEDEPGWEANLCRVQIFKLGRK